LKRLKRPPDSRRLPRLTDPGRFIKRGLMAVALLLVLGAGLVASLALFTGTCKITKVSFTGNKYLAADYLTQLSGIASYSNLVTLPVGRIARSLETNPWIADAQVKRHLLHTVEINIVERKPVAVLDCGGTGFLVDGDGFGIAQVPNEQFKELPRVHGGDVKPPAIGAFVTDAKILECLHVIKSMPASVRGLLLLGNPFDGRGPVFITSLGFNIVYGKSGGYAQKNEVLEAIIVDIKNNKRKIAYIDLRVPDSPVIKPL
jgi:cell division septal protein FtsQ